MDINQVFTSEIIEYYKTNKSEITKELLDQLRNSGNEGKQIALDILDTEKSEDNYYLDAFGNKISFLGDRNLKKAFTQMKLSPIHIEEIKRCSEDLNYFMDNYIKIRTKKGYDFAELRDYQQRFLDVLNSDSESIVAMLGRQCISGETLITLETAKVSIEMLFQECSKVAYPLNQEFTETRIPKGLKVLTPLGFREIEYVHKTIPYERYRIRTENGLTLECSERHVIIDKDNNEVYAMDSLGKEIQTVKGISKVVECQDLGFKQSMYDISIKQSENAENTELYYTNGILSHNSGKSVTVAIFMAWHFNFNHNLNIGICANKGSLAREFLNNIKEMFYSIPMWMRQGITSWSKSTIESELKMRILTDVPGPDAFRGFSISLLCVDECISGNSIITIRNKKTGQIENITVKKLFESFKHCFEVLTSNGFKDFDDVIFKGSKSGLVIQTENHSISVTKNHKFYINGDFVYARDLKVQDLVQTDTGLEKIVKITETSNDYYDLINVRDGHHFTANGIEVSNCAWIPSEKFHALMDSLLPSQAAMSWKKNIFISTPNGMNHFYDLVDGARRRKILYGQTKEQLDSLKNVLSVKQVGDSYDVTVDEPSNNHALFEMDWREVPRYNSKGERLDPEEFRKDVETKYGKVYFSQNFACVTGDTKVKIFDTQEKEVTIEDLYNKDYRNVLIKTLNGYSPFKGIRKLTVSKTLKIFFGNESIEVSEDHRFVIFGKEVYANELKVGDTLQTELETSIITNIEVFGDRKDVYDVLETEDHTYITNSVVSHNCSFLGSSYTLLSKESLQSLKPKEPIDVLDKKLLIYEEPIEDHKYIMGVDPAKSGADSFSIQVLDVTTFPFVQVAAAKLPDENFQIMPARLYDWGVYYNTAFMIVENNEGAGTYANVILFNDLEYENLYFERTFGVYRHDSKTKVEPGFRTNQRNRNLILDTFKQLVDNKKLVINDANTIKELNTFVLKNNKYQADDGCHDDMVMAMCVALAPFADVKNFDNFAEMISRMYSDSEPVKFTDYLCLGNFDDFSDDEVQPEESLVFGRPVINPWSF